MSEMTGTPSSENAPTAETAQNPPTATHEGAPQAGATPSAASMPEAGGDATAAPGGPAGWPAAGWWSPPPPRRLVRWGRSAVLAWFVAAVLAMTVVGLSVALGLSGGSTPTRGAVPFPGPRTVPLLPGGIAGPGQTPSRLAVIGTVASLGSNQFTVNALSGGTVTVNEQSSTTYYNGGAKATSSAVVTGARVVVEGTRTGNTVSAERVVVLGTGPFGGGATSGGL